METSAPVVFLRVRSKNLVFWSGRQKPRVLVPRLGAKKPRVFAPLLPTKNFESWGAAKSTQKLERAAAQGHPEPKRQKLSKTRPKTYVLNTILGHLQNAGFSPRTTTRTLRDVSGSAQSTSFLSWDRSNHIFLRLGALGP